MVSKQGPRPTWDNEKFKRVQLAWPVTKKLFFKLHPPPVAAERGAFPVQNGSLILHRLQSRYGVEQRSADADEAKFTRKPNYTKTLPRPSITF